MGASSSRLMSWENQIWLWEKSLRLLAIIAIDMNREIISTVFLSVYKNCPLPTPEDRLFFVLTYLKTYSLQVVQGRLFGMGQSKANQWIHALLPALQVTLRRLGDSPARSLSALAQRLGVSQADAAAMVEPLEESPPPAAPIGSTKAASEASPLLPMTAPRDASSAPKTLLNRPIVIAARKKITR
jgi:Helix-turn-helix of DDE superfamily endonuclease